MHNNVVSYYGSKTYIVTNYFQTSNLRPTTCKTLS